MKIGDRIHYLQSCTSTNDVVKDMAVNGAPEGTVVIAEEQTLGKGRSQCLWHSLYGKASISQSFSFL